MDYTIEYDDKNKIVVMKMKGRLNYKTAESYSTEAVKLARQNYCDKFIFDHSETDQQEGLNKLYASSEELQQFGFKDTDRISIIVFDHGKNADLLNDNNYHSKSSTVKYFFQSDYNKSIEWLNSEI